MYEINSQWEQLPAGWEHIDVCDVAVDADDRVFMAARGAHPVLVYERDGAFVASWGEDVLGNPHSITIDQTGHVYCTDLGDHTVRKFTPGGELVMTLGTPGVPSPSGFDWDGDDYRTVQRGVPPFNGPTQVAVLRDGRICVSDGYGNARVHVFSPTGELEASWGSPGEAPGSFWLPHGIVVTPDENLLVSDRENCRIQIFDVSGNLLSVWEGIDRPNNVTFDGAGRAYVAEQGYLGGRWPVWGPLKGDERGSVCTVRDADGHELWSIGRDNPGEAGWFVAAHGICVDSHGDVYVTQVGSAVEVASHAVQKLTPLAD